jgi:hypothetical protein
MRRDEKRQLRELKRKLKRAGSKRRRRQLKQDLAENPNEAQHSEFDFDRYRSAGLNALDKDATRKRREPNGGIN